MIREIEYPSYSSSVPVANVSWGAISAGTLVTIAVMASLTVLGAGIGFASAPAADTAEGLAKGLGIGTIAWLFVSGAVSYYAGGWVTGRLTRQGVVSEGVVHSAVTWAFATTAFMFMLTSAIGGTLGGAASLLGAGAQTAADGAGASTGDRLIQRAEDYAPSRSEVAAGAERASQVAGATGIAGFMLMLIQALACLAGGRGGTRVFRPHALPARRPRETEAVS